MKKTLFFRKTIIFWVFWLGLYNFNRVYGEENGLDGQRLLEVKIIEGIGKTGRVRDAKVVRRLQGIVEGEDKLLRLYAMESLYNSGRKTYLLRILKYLDDPDPDIRIGTLGVLARIKDKSTIQRVLSVFKFDRDYYVRVKAVETLVSLNYKRLNKDLLYVLDRVGSDVKLDIVYALSLLADTTDTHVLKKILEKEGYIARTYCAAALARLGDTVGPDILFKDLNDKNNPVRLLTAENIRKLNIADVSSHYPYLSYLGHKDVNERSMVIKILGKLSNEETLPLIIEKTRDKSELIRLAAVTALNDFKNRTDVLVVDALLDLLKDDSEDVKVQAIISLGEIYEKNTQYAEKASLELRKLLKDESKRVKGFTIRSLGLLEDRSSVPYIIESLSDSNAGVRKFSSMALGMMKELSASLNVIPLLDDVSRDVKVESIRTVGLLGDKSLLEEVLKKLDTKDIDVETEVLIASFKLGDPLAVDRCIEGLGSEDVTRRGASVRALGYMHTEKSISTLLSALKDRIPLVRVSSVRSLGMLRDETTLMAIIDMLGDRDREVIVEVCQALKNFGDHRAVSILKGMLDL